MKEEDAHQHTWMASYCWGQVVLEKALKICFLADNLSVVQKCVFCLLV